MVNLYRQETPDLLQCVNLTLLLHCWILEPKLLSLIFCNGFGELSADFFLFFLCLDSNLNRFTFRRSFISIINFLFSIFGSLKELGLSSSFTELSTTSPNSSCEVKRHIIWILVLLVVKASEWGFLLVLWAFDYHTLSTASCQVLLMSHEHSQTPLGHVCSIPSCGRLIQLFSWWFRLNRLITWGSGFQSLARNHLLHFTHFLLKFGKLPLVIADLGIFFLRQLFG